MTREEAIDKLLDIADRESAWMEAVGLPDASQIGAFLLEVAEMLKEKEPVKPIIERSYTGFWPLCGVCEEALTAQGKYCPHCGRAVKWDDAE